MSPRAMTRRRAASSAVFACFPIFMLIAVSGVQFYHNGKCGANAARARRRLKGSDISSAEEFRRQGFGIVCDGFFAEFRGTGEQ